MKNTRVFAAAGLAALCVVLGACGQKQTESTVTVDDPAYYAKFRDQNITLNVYNWGEYISDGTDGSMDVIREFELISGIDVNYTMYDTNEDMYAKLAGGGSQYDIIIPSDYMIARLIKEDMVEKINYDNIPNIKYINEDCLYTAFDPNGEYAVPYTWGMVGLIYNTKYVTEEEAQSWNLLWDEKYKGKLLMFGNSRDAYGVALRLCDYSLNPDSTEQIEDATELLKKQKEIIQAYAMDQTFDKMANENAYAAPYYAGDCATMMDRNEDLAFSYPKEGVNRFIDSMCIPKGSKNKEAAEAFINFICETEVAAANCDYISYFTPQLEAEKLVGMDERIAPTEEDTANSEVFSILPDEINDKMENDWVELLKSSGADQSGEKKDWVVVLGIVLLLALAIFVIVTVIRKKNKKQEY